MGGWFKKSLKTPLRNIKMAPYYSFKISIKQSVEETKYSVGTAIQGLRLFQGLGHRSIPDSIE